MNDLLTLCRDMPLVSLAAGEVFLREGERSGRLYVLAEGAIEVYRGSVTIALVTEPGAVFGEMALLLGVPHTAHVRAAAAAKLHVVENALAYLKATPALLVPIAQLLARRLQSSTTYLVDLKRQFQHHSDHFAMMDEVLESLTHQQGAGFTPAGGLPAEPSA